jgi:AcrR family transcriptional regulator
MARPENKDFILQKTFLLLLIKGYDGVSISDIQKETSMSRGIIYHYFSSKEELFRVATETFFLTPFSITPKDTEGLNLSQMIEYIITKYRKLLKSWNHYFGIAQITMANYDFLFFQMTQKEETIAKTYMRLRAEERKAWINAVQTSLNKGEIRSVIHVETIASHFMLILDGIWASTVENNSMSQYFKLMNRALRDYYKLLKV